MESDDPSWALTGFIAHLQATLFAALEEFPATMSVQQAQEVPSVGFQLLGSYNGLSSLAHEKGKCLWSLKPKLHAAYHLPRAQPPSDTKRNNPT
jgi:hypothetical protein